MWDQNYSVSSIGEYDLSISTYTPEYPTTTTNKVGHYNYFNSQGDASTTFLNCSNYLGGTAGDGGFQFHQASSTLSPLRLMKVDTTQVLVETQFKVDKSTSSTTLIALPVVTISGARFVITATPVNVPPYNITGVGNPVQVNSNCANLSTGITYYATGLTTQSMEICLNADGTGIIDTTDLSSQPQPILSWVSGTSTISKTSVLNDILTITNDTDVSILSSTDLTFNGTSIPSNISTLTIKQTNSLQVYSSPVIYADGRPPIAVPSTIANTYAQFGWYFKNTSAGWKINWYMAPDTNMVVGDILGLYMRLFNCGTTSNDDTPFITIYTKPTGSGDYAWYHSSMTYILSGSITPNTSYTFFENVNSCPDPAHYASLLIGMIPSPVDNPRGTYSDDQQILAISIGTNSASPVNSVEFILQKLGIMTASGTTEFLFQTL